jgi:hypothetical protein
MHNYFASQSTISIKYVSVFAEPIFTDYWIIQEEQALKLMRLLMHLQGRLASCHGPFTSLLLEHNLPSTQRKRKRDESCKRKCKPTFSKQQAPPLSGPN